MKKKMIYCMTVLMLIFGGGIGWYEYYKAVVPDALTIRYGSREQFDLSIPALINIPGSEEWCSLLQPFSMTADQTGTYEMPVRLLGIFPLKTIEVQAVTERYAIPCGCPVGIYMKTDGVMVIDTVSLIDKNGNEVSPTSNVLQTGDYILAVDGRPITEKEELSAAVDQGMGQRMILTLRRKGEVIDVAYTPAEVTNGVYKAGVWVRDDMQGIGTLTYISDGSYGALGHGVNDADTGLLVEASEGELHKAKVLGIEKGDIGSPGSVVGSVDYSEQGILGTIEKNTECGIMGRIYDPEDVTGGKDQVPYPVGYKQDAYIGKAAIWSDVSGELKEYEVEITAIHMGGSQSTKGIELYVTDPELIALTGGIIQGMSGSPIIQNGKLIGAVTHVFVKDPTRGYGIFLEEMM